MDKFPVSNRLYLVGIEAYLLAQTRPTKIKKFPARLIYEPHLNPDVINVNVINHIKRIISMAIYYESGIFCSGPSNFVSHKKSLEC